MELPLTGKPEEILSKLIPYVKVKSYEVKYRKFRIGRTSEPNTRKIRLGCDELEELYTTKDDEEAKKVEEALLVDRKNHPKLDVEVIDSRGGVADPPYFVYIALWEKS